MCVCAKGNIRIPSWSKMILLNGSDNSSLLVEGAYSRVVPEQPALGPPPLPLYHVHVGGSGVHQWDRVQLGL